MKNILCTKTVSKKNKSNQSFETFQSFHSQLRSLIASLKNKYYSKVIKRLLDPSASPKMYWSILKTLLNKKKIPLFRQFFMIINILQVLKKKAEIFNPHLSKQYSRLISNSKIPSECSYLLLLLK